MTNRTRKWMAAATVAAAMVGGVALVPAAVGAGSPANNVSVALEVTKVLDGTPTPDWPITAEILGDTGATFSSTQTDVAPVEWYDNGNPVLLNVNNLPAEGVTVAIRETARPDVAFTDYYCQGGNPSSTVTGEVIVTLPVFTMASPTPVRCSLYNTTTIPFTIEKHVNGATTPTAGYDLVVEPYIYGEADPSAEFWNGATLSSDPVAFTSAATATTLQFIGQSEGSPQFVIGELVNDGSQLTEITCEGDYVPSQNSPGLTATANVSTPLDVLYVEPQQRGNRWFVGGTFTVDRSTVLGELDGVSCLVENDVPNLSVTKTASSASVQPNGSLTYSVVVTNSGAADLEDAVMTDPLPVGVTAVSATIAGGGVSPCPVAANAVTCDLGDLPKAASRTVTITVTVNGNVANGAVLVNTASVTATYPLWTVVPFVPVATVALAVALPPPTRGSITRTSSVTVNAAIPTTTTVAPTTTDAGGLAPAPTTTFAGTLPATGPGGSEVPIAAGTVGLGALLLLVVRRRRPSHA